MANLRPIDSICECIRQSESSVLPQFCQIPLAWPGMHPFMTHQRRETTPPVAAHNLLPNDLSQLVHSSLHTEQFYPVNSPVDRQNCPRLRNSRLVSRIHVRNSLNTLFPSRNRISRTSCAKKRLKMGRFKEDRTDLERIAQPPHFECCSSRAFTDNLNCQQFSGPSEDLKGECA